MKETILLPIILIVCVVLGIIIINNHRSFNAKLNQISEIKQKDYSPEIRELENKLISHNGTTIDQFEVFNKRLSALEEKLSKPAEQVSSKPSVKKSFRKKCTCKSKVRKVVTK